MQEEQMDVSLCCLDMWLCCLCNVEFRGQKLWNLGRTHVCLLECTEHHLSTFPIYFAHLVCSSFLCVAPIPAHLQKLPNLDVPESNMSSHLPSSPCPSGESERSMGYSMVQHGTSVWHGLSGRYYPTPPRPTHPLVLEVIHFLVLKVSQWCSKWSGAQSYPLSGAQSDPYRVTTFCCPWSFEGFLFVFS